MAEPSAAVLVAAVREFIAGLSLDGRDAFHAKVSANALAIVERELANEPDRAEAAALAPLVPMRSSPPSLPLSPPSLLLSPPSLSSSPRRRGSISTTVGVMDSRLRGDDGVVAMRATICAAIRDGSLGPATPGLLDALIAANLARLAVDNPRYSTFVRRTPAAAPQR